MVSANEPRSQLLTYTITWKDRKRQYLFVGDVDEQSASNHEAFSRPQGERVFHISLEVGTIASNNLKISCFSWGCGYQVRKLVLFPTT